jgi:hypothetical protein
MRFALLAVLVGCTPEIVPGSYLCGPNASCPEGQACNGPDNTCVFDGAELPFECEPQIESEPDNTSSQAALIGNLDCVSIPFVNASCMLAGDAADWVKFTVPSVCSSVEVEARVSFPLAFARLGLELWDLDRDQHVASDTPCTGAGGGEVGEVGEEKRCLEIDVTPGTSYGIQVSPAGDGDCDGTCIYNRYTLRVQLVPPG